MKWSFSSLLGASCLISVSTATPLQRRATGPVCGVTQGYNVSNVIAKGTALSSKAVDYGYHSEALLEYFNPGLSVFYEYSFPDGKIPVAKGTEQGLAYAKNYIQLGQPILSTAGGSNMSGDPATLGTAAILLGANNKQYQAAAAAQANYLLTKVPLVYNGAISSVNTDAELWDEWVGTAAPFLAYYAAATGNTTLLNYTVNQIGLYRNFLKTGSTTWIHIDSLAEDDDMGTFGAGNAFAAYGIARVLGIVHNWGPSAAFEPQKSNLIAWAKEILDGSTPDGNRVGPSFSSQYAVNAALDDQGLLWNYFNYHTFGETTSTAFLAAAVYRLAVLAPDTFGSGTSSSYIQWAQVNRGAINGHVYSDGTLVPAYSPINPQDFQPWSQGNPASQSAAIILAAAWRDCVCAGICPTP